MLKRTISLALAAVLALGCLPLTALAQDEQGTGDEYQDALQRRMAQIAPAAEGGAGQPLRQNQRQVLDFNTDWLFIQGDDEAAKEPGYELFIKGALLRFLALLIAQGKNLPPMETADSRRLKKILQWVAEHYGEEVHISDAAQLVPCSESHFMRWFRQMTGQSFIAFLKEYRLNAAAEALHTTDDTVLSIASRCGFENLSYFNRAFKAHFGLTPREHRKK